MGDPLNLGRLRQLTIPVPDEAELHGYLNSQGVTIQAEWVEDGEIYNPVIMRIPFDITAGAAAEDPDSWLAYQADAKPNEDDESDTTETTECPGFAWIGQPLTSCDNCGKPIWDHDYDQRIDKNAVPFGPWQYVPWQADLIDEWRRKGYIRRAMHLLSLTSKHNGPTAP